MTKPLSRSQWLTILRAGIGTESWQFVYQASEAYLHEIPNDIAVRLFQSEALLGMGNRAEAYQIASSAALADPEERRAHSLRYRAMPLSASPETRAEITGALAALGAVPSGVQPPAWSQALRRAYQAMQTGQLAEAQSALFPALPGNGHIPLLAVAHLRLVWAQKDWAATLHLARTYSERWPETLAFRLILAHQLAESGQETESVAMLHTLAMEDPAAQVLHRLFGARPPYLAMWPQNLSVPMEIPLPAAVAAALGYNHLPAPSSPPGQKAAKAAHSKGKQAATPPPSPPQGKTAPDAEPQVQPAPSRNAPSQRPARTPSPQKHKPARKNTKATKGRVKKAEQAFSKAAHRLKVGYLAQTEGRFPVYVILSTREGLEKHYGPETAKIILRHMKQLAAAVSHTAEWGALVLLADDAASAHTHGVKPVQHRDPWALKKQLAALDAALGRKGSMIGALLIVGGDEIVPFHKLPNPLEDDDDVVLSDNPYGAIDENYLAPTWPVGRLPGGSDGDATLLLGALRRITAEHRTRQPKKAWRHRWLEKIRAFLSFRRRRRLTTLGYTAAVWEKSSRAVFKTIGSSKTLLASPPLQAETLGILPRAHLAYFNLHGIAEAAPWYGQRLPTASDAPDYPIALRPEDIPAKEQAPKVVFSEACYGAYLRDKNAQNAMCLRFLYAGSHAFVGSTATAYGTVEAPLSAADLLGQLFWQRLKAGLPVGEALRQAKYLYAHEAHQRFGFLDGEDQKTLISFVLYGDPLCRPLAQRSFAVGKGVLRPKAMPSLRTAEERMTVTETGLPPRISKRVKTLVETYLPGSDSINMLLAEESVEGLEERQKSPSQHVARKVVVVTKQVTTGAITHRHVMRVAMDPRGKVLKVSLSH